MVFKRDWDSTCPRVWDQWEANGVKWVVQDLPPEDDEEALEIFRQYMLPDELLSSCSGIAKDPESVNGSIEFWRNCMGKRTSLACYAEVDSKRTLVGLNVCLVKCTDDNEEEPEPKWEALRNVLLAVHYLESKLNVFEQHGVNTYLSAVGLVIKRDYRGAGLGSKILAAREQFCRAHNIKVTSTIFTGPASQKSAAKCGFNTDLVVPLGELADIGLNYPRDDRIIKIMSKRYD